MFSHFASIWGLLATRVGLVIPYVSWIQSQVLPVSLCPTAWRRHDLLVGDYGVDFGTVVTLDTETDFLVGFKVITVVGNGSFVNESELVCWDTVFVRCLSAIVRDSPRPPGVEPKAVSKDWLTDGIASISSLDSGSPSTSVNSGPGGCIFEP